MADITSLQEVESALKQVQKLLTEIEKGMPGVSSSSDLVEEIQKAIGARDELRHNLEQQKLVLLQRISQAWWLLAAENRPARIKAIAPLDSTSSKSDEFVGFLDEKRIIFVDIKDNPPDEYSAFWAPSYTVGTLDEVVRWRGFASITNAFVRQIREAIRTKFENAAKQTSEESVRLSKVFDELRTLLATTQEG